MGRFFTALWLALTLGPLGAAAEPWPTPNAAYQATRVMTSGGLQMSGQLFHDHGKERWEVEMQGMTQVMITRPDLEKMFMFMPQMNMAMELPLDQGRQVPGPEQYDGVEPEIVGQEEIAGEQATKYKFEGDESTGPFTVFVWMTDDGITLRTEGSSGDGSFEMYLEGLQRGEQSADLFELPANAQIMPANPAMMDQMLPGQ